MKNVYNGFRNSFRYDIIYNKFFRYKCIRKILIKSFGFNIFIICATYLVFALSFDCHLRYYHNVVRILLTFSYFAIIQLPLCIISIILNNIWRSKIVNVILNKNLSKLKGNVELTTKQTISLFIHENLHIFIFYVFNWIFIMLFTTVLPYVLYAYIPKFYNYMNIGGVNVLNIIFKIFEIALNSLLCSCYCLEYTLRHPLLTSRRGNYWIISRLEYTEKHALYFTGYCITLQLLNCFLPVFIFWGIFEFCITILLIISLYTKHDNNKPINIFYLQKKIMPFITNKLLTFFITVTT